MPLNLLKYAEFLGIDVIKDVQDRHTENYKTLLRENKDDLSKWRDKPCSWIERLKIVKILVLCKLNYRFSAIPIGVFVELDEMIQGQEIARALSKENKVRGIVY